MKRLGRILRLASELGLVVGLLAAGSVLLGLAVGRWLDAKLGSGPYATILLMLAGAAAGQTAAYRLASRSARRLSSGSSHALRPRDAATATGLAIRLLVLVSLPSLVGLVLGLWIDRLLGTEIVATLLLALIGLASGVLLLLRTAYTERPVAEREDEKRCGRNIEDS